MAEQTPRINASYLEQFTHRTVRILGKVTQLRGEEATIDAGGQINVHLNRVCFDCFSSISYILLAVSIACCTLHQNTLCMMSIGITLRCSFAIHISPERSY